MNIDQSQAGQHVQLSVGQVAELRLPENPTAGYRWVVTSPASPACRLADDSFRASPGSPGRGGEHFWRITALAAGVCDLQLTYRRSFAPDPSGDTVFALHLQVTG